MTDEKEIQKAAIKHPTIQDRHPNWRDSGKLYLRRCYNCEPTLGRENYAPLVASGTCAWCGWKEEEEETK